MRDHKVISSYIPSSLSSPLGIRILTLFLYSSASRFARFSPVQPLFNGHLQTAIRSNMASTQEVTNCSLNHDTQSPAGKGHLPSLSPPYCVEFPFQKAFLSLNRPSSSSCLSVWMLLPKGDDLSCLLLLLLLRLVVSVLRYTPEDIPVPCRSF